MKETFKLQVPAGIATGIGNALRQISMGSLTCWAPVAISLGPEASLLSSPYTTEDTPQIIGEIKSLIFKPKSEAIASTEVHHLEFEVRGSMKFSDLQNPYFEVLYEEDREFIHSLNGMAIPLKIYLYKGTGNNTNVNNRDLLWRTGMNLETLLVTSSRHIIVDTFNVKNLPVKDRLSSDTEELTLEISSNISNPKDILTSSIDELIQQLHIAKKQIENHSENS